MDTEVDFAEGERNVCAVLYNFLGCSFNLRRVDDHIDIPGCDNRGGGPQDTLIER
jgi:hypothetical protein